jgi:methylenetetrahydrofolate dehydrogenase (NADP+)/methenyltetrahydrofolate cyclohydrolase
MADIIDGKIYSARVREQVARQVAVLQEKHGLTPGLAVVIVGEDPASQVYVRNKGKAADAAGIASRTIELPVDSSLEQVLDTVHSLNTDPAMHGILVQLPMPDHIDELQVTHAIDPAKDVDGLHVVNAGRLAVGLPALVPCTPRGCMVMLEDRFGPGGMSGLEAVVIGRSMLVGKPMAQLLLGANCTVTMAHSRTRDLPAVCRRADIVVAAVGQPRMVKGDWIKPGATVIDVGINRIDAGDGKTRLVGDVDFDSAAAVAGAITPVPGGVGLMTVACLLANTVTAACRQHGIEEPAA